MTDMTFHKEVIYNLQLLLMICTEIHTHPYRVKMEALACTNLTEEFIASENYRNYDVIGIDEAQFFSDVRNLAC